MAYEVAYMDKSIGRVITEAGLNEKAVAALFNSPKVQVLTVRVLFE